MIACTLTMGKLGIALILVGLLFVSILFINNSIYAEMEKEKQSTKAQDVRTYDEEGKRKVIIMYKNLVKNKDISELKAESYAKIKKKFKIINGVAASMDEKWIEKIRAKKNVLGVFDDSPVQAMMDQSITQINAVAVHSAGITGNGVITSTSTGSLSSAKVLGI